MHSRVEDGERGGTGNPDLSNLAMANVSLARSLSLSPSTKVDGAVVICILSGFLLFSAHFSLLEAKGGVAAGRLRFPPIHPLKTRNEARPKISLQLQLPKGGERPRKGWKVSKGRCEWQIALNGSLNYLAAAESSTPKRGADGASKNTNEIVKSAIIAPNTYNPPPASHLTSPKRSKWCTLLEKKMAGSEGSFPPQSKESTSLPRFCYQPIYSVRYPNVNKALSLPLFLGNKA